MFHAWPSIAERHFKFLALVICLVAASSVWSDSASLEPSDSDSIQDHLVAGTWNVVMIWAHDCVACNQEAADYSALHSRHTGKTAEVLGISMDGKDFRAEARKFVERHNLTFPSLLLEPAELVSYYEFMTQTPWVGTPSFMIFDPQGNLAAKQAGAIPAQLIDQFLEQYKDS